MSVNKLINNFCILTFVTALCWTTDAVADYKLNMTPGVTETSRMVYDLHMRALWMVTIIAVLVFAVMIYSLATHRKSKGAVIRRRMKESGKSYDKIGRIFFAALRLCERWLFT